MFSHTHQLYIRTIFAFFLLSGWSIIQFSSGLPDELHSLFSWGQVSVYAHGDQSSMHDGRLGWPEIQLQKPILSLPTEESVIMYIPHTNILTILQTSDTYLEAHQRIRILLLKALIARGFSGFLSTPFDEGNEKIVLLANTGFADFIMLQDIEQKDDLDNLILNKLIRYAQKHSQNSLINGLEISEEDYAGLSDIYLFKSNEDLYALGYELVSYRYRTNADAAYRRHNISTAFSKLGNVRIINPGEIFSFQHTIQSSTQGKFTLGTAIVRGQVVSMYAGGLCGASTALYQGILTNTALEIIERYPHSKRYANLYDSFIDGQSINIPGLDSTVFFTENKDIQITNTRHYPLIVVLNYDGSIGGMEEVFSLAQGNDKGSLEYKGLIGKRCYVREINGNDVSSCYQQVF